MELTCPLNAVQEPFAATQSMTKDDVGKMFEGQYEYKDFPSWTKTVDQINEQVGRRRARLLPTILACAVLCRWVIAGRSASRLRPSQCRGASVTL